MATGVVTPKPNISNRELCRLYKEICNGYVPKNYRDRPKIYIHDDGYGRRRWTILRSARDETRTGALT